MKTDRVVGMMNPLRDENKGMLMPAGGGWNTPVTTACPEPWLECKRDGPKQKNWKKRFAFVSYKFEPNVQIVS